MPRIIGRDERVTPRSGAEDIVAAIAESTRASLAAVNASLGEIAHFPDALEGPRCGCGSYGCVESLAAGRFVAEAYGVDDAARVYAAAAAGDEAAERIVTRAEKALGNLAVGLANALSPALIVIGGSVAEHEPSHTLEPMRRAIADRAL